MNLLFTIYWTFCYFGAICMSGGNSLLPFYIDELVSKRGWMTLEELGNFMAIAQVTPGPIGINMATFLGHNQAGFLGGIVATVALLTPSFIMMSIALRFIDVFAEARIVRSLMYAVKPVTIALMFTALLALMGMSIFSKEIPLDCLWNVYRGKAAFGEEPFFLHWDMLLPFIFSIVMLYRKKLSIMKVIFIAAGYGAIIGWMWSYFRFV